MRPRSGSFGGLFAGLLAPLMAAVMLAAGAGPAAAAATAWLDHEQVQLRLLSAGGPAEDGLRLGLQFRLQPGWKIYWRTPGEAGFPPTVDWSGSENLAEAEILWPVAHRFTLFGLDTFGYSDEVVLPVRARAVEPGAPVALRAMVSYLTCSNICVPHDGVLDLVVPGGSTPGSAEAGLIARAERLVPGDGSAVGLSFERAALLVGDPDPVLEVVARSRTPFEAPDVLVEGPPGFTFARPEVELRDGGTLAVMRLQSGRGFLAEGVLEGKRIVLTVTDGTRAMEVQSITRFVAGAGRAFDGLALIEMIGLALLGGLILNLMPCVLPVLSIKLLSVVKQGGRERREVRIGFLASAAGFSFPSWSWPGSPSPSRPPGWPRAGASSSSSPCSSRPWRWCSRSSRPTSLDSSRSRCRRRLRTSPARGRGMAWSAISRPAPSRPCWRRPARRLSSAPPSASRWPAGRPRSW